jgi:hypothetical protein
MDTPGRGDVERLRGGNGKFTRSPDAARKRDRAVELRAQGWTYEAIALEVGYANRASAQKAINAALASIPQASCSQLIRQEEERLAEMDARLSRLIETGAVKTTSIGRTQFDVRTCTCPTKARTDRDHDEDCQVQPVLDEHLIISAIKERRAVGESLRKLRGADAPAGPTTIIDARVQTLIADANVKRVAAGMQPFRPL